MAGKKAKTPKKRTKRAIKKKAAKHKAVKRKAVKKAKKAQKKKSIQTSWKKISAKARKKLVQHKEETRFAEIPFSTTSCPICSSDNVVYESEAEEVICRDCGAITTKTH